MHPIPNDIFLSNLYVEYIINTNTIPEIIDKMTIRVPITGKKINIFVLLFILIGISSAAAGYYIFKRNKK